MREIFEMTALGMLAGTISIFWTRVTYRRMIFSFVFRWMQEMDYKHMFKTGRGEGHPLSNFLNCVFCLTPWIVFLLETYYIIDYSPAVIPAIIGVLGGLGAGNLFCEVIYILREYDQS